MRRLSTVCAVVAMLGAAHAASADPIHIAFNVDGFGPQNMQQSTFTRENVIDDIDFTFSAYHEGVQLQDAQNPTTLWWDAFDEVGSADGFGVAGGPGYTNDEIEGTERLALHFSRGVNLLGFDLTDFFWEEEPNDADCQAGMEYCYQERGSFMLEFGDGTTSNWFDFIADLAAVRSTNGVFDTSFSFFNVVGIIFRSPGETPGAYGNPNVMLEDYSLAGVRIDVPTVPEPGTLMLMGLGLSSLAAAARRRRQAS